MILLDAVNQLADKVISTLQQAVDKYGPALVHASSQEVSAQVALGRTCMVISFGLAGVFMLATLACGYYQTKTDKAYAAAKNSYNSKSEAAGGWAIAFFLLMVVALITGFIFLVSTNYVQSSFEWQVVYNLKQLTN